MTVEKLAEQLGAIPPKTMCRNLLSQHKCGNVAATRTLLHLYMRSKGDLDEKYKGRHRLLAGDQSFERDLNLALRNISWQKIIHDLNQPRRGVPAAVELRLELQQQLYDITD